IHVAAAADADHDVGIKLAGGLRTRVDEFEVNVGPSVREDQDFRAAFFEQCLNFIGDAALDEILVAADHCAMTELFADSAEFLEHTPAEKYAASGGKTPVPITCRLWSGVALRHAKPPRDAESRLPAALRAA